MTSRLTLGTGVLLLLVTTDCYRLPDHRTLYPADVVLFEGILVLYSNDVREMLQMKLFVDTDSDTRLARRGDTPL